MVSTAISRGWIGPRLQLAGAVVGGLALIAGGLKLRDREGWGESLVFVGLAVLFVCAGASWEWLELGSASLAAVMAVLVGALAIALARYMSAWTLGLVALAGLIIVPIWWFECRPSGRARILAPLSADHPSGHDCALPGPDMGSLVGADGAR